MLWTCSEDAANRRRVHRIRVSGRCAMRLRRWCWRFWQSRLSLGLGSLGGGVDGGDIGYITSFHATRQLKGDIFV